MSEFAIQQKTQHFGISVLDRETAPVEGLSRAAIVMLASGFERLKKTGYILLVYMRGATNVNEVLHPVKDAARQLGISIWTLRKKAYDREIGSVKIGSKLLIPRSEIDWLIQSGMRPRRSHVQGSLPGLAEAYGPSRDPEARTEPRCEEGAT